jgi:hypothetical protein
VEAVSRSFQAKVAAPDGKSVSFAKVLPCLTTC